MRNLVMLALVLCAVAFLSIAPDQALAQNAPQSAQTSAAPGTATVTGCLKGSKNQYYVMEKNGTRHLLLAKGKDLSPYVDHEVTVTGKADNNRDASASSDEGTAFGNRFLSLDSVSDLGACKK